MALARDALTADQRRRLRVALEEFGQRLDEAERLVLAVPTDSPFERYVPDLTPALRDTLRADLASLRQATAATLAELGLTPGGPRCTVSWAARALAIGLGGTLEELAPRRLRAYGPVPEPVAKQLEQLLARLNAGVTEFLEHLGPDEAGAGSAPVATGP